MTLAIHQQVRVRPMEQLLESWSNVHSWSRWSNVFESLNNSKVEGGGEDANNNSEKVGARPFGDK